MPFLTPLFGATSCGALLGAALFAEADANTWVLVVQIVATMVGGYFVTQQARDKMAFDAEKAGLKAQVEQNSKGIADCDEDRAALREDVSQLRGMLGQTHAGLQRVGKKMRESEKREAERHPGDPPSEDGSGPLPPLPPDGIDRRGP